MFRKIRQFLFYEATVNDSVQKVRAQIMEDNRRFAFIWAAAQSMYWVYCLIMSTREPDFMMCQNIYRVALVVCAVAMILAFFAAPKASWMVQPITLMVDMALLGAGISIARLLAPKTIIIFTSVLIVPVFFISDLLSTLLLLILNAVAFAVLGINSMEAETFRWTLVNLIVFSSVGLILGYFVNKARFERYFYAESAMQLAESNAKLAELQTRYAYYDQMTGLQNRRAYAEKNDQLDQGMPAGCCVIIADINGLKEMNDQYGHDAGDELIIGTAECLRQSFGQIDTIYRIGGDEFCVILNSTAEQIEEHLKQLDQNGRRWKGKFVNGISISSGYATDKEFDDFDTMQKAADQRMYENKNEYYKTTGKKKRRR